MMSFMFLGSERFNFPNRAAFCAALHPTDDYSCFVEMTTDPREGGKVTRMA